MKRTETIKLLTFFLQEQIHKKVSDKQLAINVLDFLEYLESTKGEKK